MLVGRRVRSEALQGAPAGLEATKQAIEWSR